MQSEETMIQKDTCTPMLRAALFITAETQQQVKCSSTVQWTKKMWCMYTCIHTVEYYSAIREGDNVICSDMYGPGDDRTAGSQRKTNTAQYYSYAESNF